jgi:hypothetical protein
MEKELGMNLSSRYNLRVNELLYYSQGDGDTKTYFQTKGVLGKFFDSQTNYATVLRNPTW